MLIAYYSKTGKVKRFIDKISEYGIECLDIRENQIIKEEYVLITPTQGHGQVPHEVELFLKENSDNMIAVASSGNMAWGINLFAKSGDIISKQYNVPLLMKFENQGFRKDVDLFLERVYEIYGKMD